MNGKTIIKLNAEQLRFITHSCCLVLENINSYKSDSSRHLAALIMAELAPKLSAKCFVLDATKKYSVKVNPSEALALKLLLPGIANLLGEWEKNEARILAGTFDQKLI